MRIRILSLATVVFLLLLAAGVNAQQKELRQIHLNVFRVDAATVAARGRGFFANEGIDVKTTITPDSTSQMRGISKSVLDLRTQFGFTLPKGTALETYYDLGYYRAAAGR